MPKSNYKLQNLHEEYYHNSPHLSHNQKRPASSQVFFDGLLLCESEIYRVRRKRHEHIYNRSFHTFYRIVYSYVARAGIDVLADVRAFPASRRFPQFNQDSLKKSLAAHDIEYEYLPLLAGRRNKSQSVQEVLNASWENQSFHNYADYTLTDDFQKGIQQLTQIARDKRTAYCCSERHPSRCHRLIISNWLAAHDWSVYHIISQGDDVKIVSHELGQWGAMPIIEEDGAVVYPKLGNDS